MCPNTQCLRGRSTATAYTSVRRPNAPESNCRAGGRWPTWPPHTTLGRLASGWWWWWPTRICARSADLGSATICGTQTLVRIGQMPAQLTNLCRRWHWRSGAASTGQDWRRRTHCTERSLSPNCCDNRRYRRLERYSDGFRMVYTNCMTVREW